MVDARNRLLELLEVDIVDFSSNERDKTKKLEQRLADAVLGKFTAEKSRNLATNLLNDQMENMIIPQSIFDFLRGVWFDSLQLIAIRQGEDSDEWRQAVQLTETLISTIQPIRSGEEFEGDIDKMPEEVALDVEIELILGGEQSDDTTVNPINTSSTKADQQLFRIIEHLPAELKSSLVSIEHDNEARERTRQHRIRSRSYYERRTYRGL